MTQSFIVYRNPLEQAFWEGVMNGDFFPFMVAGVVFIVMVVVMNSIYDTFFSKHYYSRARKIHWFQNAFLFIPAFVVSGLVLNFMWI